MLPPLSEFNCANQYVLSGFDRENFDRITRHYLKLIGRFVEKPTEEELAHAYLRTGGNTYFLRLILWSLFDRHAGEFDDPIQQRADRRGSRREGCVPYPLELTASLHPQCDRERSQVLAASSSN